MTRRKDNRETRLPVPAQDLLDFTPVPSRTNRHDGWTPARQRDFIEALADKGSVEGACKSVNMSTVGAYRIRRLAEGASFRKAWEAALTLGVRRLEDVAMDRALNGVDVPVYSYGKLVGLRKSYNDRLLMFMLRNRAPERFAEGRAKGMNAAELTKLEQEKKKWRKEWELEQRDKHPQVSPAEVRASIDRKVEAFRKAVEAERQREWESLSEETREAWERFEALKARDQGRAQAAGGGSAGKTTRAEAAGGGSASKTTRAQAAGGGSASACAEDFADADAPTTNTSSPRIMRLPDRGFG